jgi:hypothetical protein
MIEKAAMRQIWRYLDEGRLHEVEEAGQLDGARPVLADAVDEDKSRGEEVVQQAELDAERKAAVEEGQD